MHGEEEYLKETALSAIRKALSGGLPEMNETVLIVSKADDIIAARNPTFMSEKRLIIVKTTSLQTAVNWRRWALASYLQNMSSNCCFSFIVVANKTVNLQSYRQVRRCV